jgi:hypothetical protein
VPGASSEAPDHRPGARTALLLLGVRRRPERDAPRRSLRPGAARPDHPGAVDRARGVHPRAGPDHRRGRQVPASRRDRRRAARPGARQHPPGDRLDRHPGGDPGRDRRAHRAGHLRADGRARRPRHPHGGGHRPPLVVGVLLPGLRHLHRQRARDAGRRPRPARADRRRPGPLPDQDGVIHSYWVPALGGKQDAVPARSPTSTSRPTSPAATSASARSTAACPTSTCATAPWR